jgi:hypothetical protein
VVFDRAPEGRQKPDAFQSPHHLSFNPLATPFSTNPPNGDVSVFPIRAYPCYPWFQMLLKINDFHSSRRKGAKLSGMAFNF